MHELVIHNAQTPQPGGGRCAVSVCVKGGVIQAVDTDPGDAEAAAPDAERIDAGGRLLTPGLIDLHIHGNERFLFERDPDEMLEGLASLSKYGVTTVLPTLYRVLGPDQLDTLEKLAEALATCDTVHAPGFHYEGPFLKLAGAGGLTMDGDVAHLDAVLDAANGLVSAMSISPDTKNIVAVIERLIERGVVPFITHTKAGVDETVAAIAAGARHATHFYDVFYPPDETEPGARPVGCVETVLADARVSVDFIADGVHVHPMAIKAALAAKGPSGIVAITDANIGAGLGPGVYDTPWGFEVKVEAGDATRIHLPGSPKDRTLAGSNLTMPGAVANLRRWLDLPEYEIWAMATRNPADRMNLPRKGRLEVGADADLVLWDEGSGGGLTAARTWLGGKDVFQSQSLSETQS